MPNIKSPNVKETMICTVCGQFVQIGNYNWTYNTQNRGTYRHHICNLGMVSDRNEAIRRGWITDTRTNITQVQPDPIALPNEPPAIDPLPEPPNPIPTYNGHVLDAVLDFPELKHYQLGEIIDILKRRAYPLLWGSPGAGKTYLALQIEKATEHIWTGKRFGLKSLIIQGCEDSSKIEIMGVVSPITNLFIVPAFYDRWINGGVIIFDECFCCPASFLNTLNSALAQKRIDFPNGESHQMHEHCYIIFADNTNGWGKDNRYPERMNCGPAFRNRVDFLHFEYDPTLEKAITRQFLSAELTKLWIKFAHMCRRHLEASQLPVCASPRFIQEGARIIHQSLGSNRPITKELILKILSLKLWEGLDFDPRTKDAITLAQQAIEVSAELYNLVHNGESN